jgi:hypothetical protein
MVRHMILILVLSLPLRVYCHINITLFGETLWTALIVQYHILAVSLVFGKICKIWCYWVVCAYLFSTSQILLSLGDLSGQGAEGNSDANWFPCPVEMLGWLSFILISHYYVLNKLKMQIFFRCFLNVVTIDLWSLFCALLSLFQGYILSSFPWFVNMKLESSCLLVTAFSLHHCIWDCHLVLSLNAFDFLLTFVVK